MKISQLKCGFGPEAKNRIMKAHEKSEEGAIACLETFYYSCNRKDIATFRSVWHLDSLIKLNRIEEMYHKIFRGSFVLWVKFSDILCYYTDEVVVFTGVETVEFSDGYKSFPQKFITTRVFAYAEADEQ